MGHRGVLMKAVFSTCFDQEQAPWKEWGWTHVLHCCFSVAGVGRLNFNTCLLLLLLYGQLRECTIWFTAISLSCFLETVADDMVLPYQDLYYHVHCGRTWTWCQWSSRYVMTNIQLLFNRMRVCIMFFFNYGKNAKMGEWLLQPTNKKYIRALDCLLLNFLVTNLKYW